MHAADPGCNRSVPEFVPPFFEVRRTVKRLISELNQSAFFKCFYDARRDPCEITELIYRDRAAGQEDVEHLFMLCAERTRPSQIERYLFG